MEGGSEMALHNKCSTQNKDVPLCVKKGKLLRENRGERGIDEESPEFNRPAQRTVAAECMLNHRLTRTPTIFGGSTEQY